MSKSTLIPVILQQISPILERLVEQIAVDNNLDAKALKKKYLSDLKEYKKKPSKRKGVINPYAAFLGDKDVEDKLRKDHPEATFGELSKLKGPIWKSLSKKEKEKYQEMALEITKQNQKKTSDDDQTVEGDVDTVEI